MISLCLISPGSYDNESLNVLVLVFECVMKDFVFEAKHPPFLTAVACFTHSVTEHMAGHQVQLWWSKECAWRQLIVVVLLC